EGSHPKSLETFPPPEGCHPKSWEPSRHRRDTMRSLWNLPATGGMPCEVCGNLPATGGMPCEVFGILPATRSNTKKNPDGPGPGRSSKKKVEFSQYGHLRWSDGCMLYQVSWVYP